MSTDVKVTTESVVEEPEEERLEKARNIIQHEQAHEPWDTLKKRPEVIARRKGGMEISQTLKNLQTARGQRAKEAFDKLAPEDRKKIELYRQREKAIQAIARLTGKKVEEVTDWSNTELTQEMEKLGKRTVDNEVSAWRSEMVTAQMESHRDDFKILFAAEPLKYEREVIENIATYNAESLVPTRNAIDTIVANFRKAKPQQPRDTAKISAAAANTNIQKNPKQNP